MIVSFLLFLLFVSAAERSVRACFDPQTNTKCYASAAFASAGPAVIFGAAGVGALVGGPVAVALTLAAYALAALTMLVAGGLGLWGLAETFRRPERGRAGRGPAALAVCLAAAAVVVPLLVAARVA